MKYRNILLRIFLYFKITGTEYHHFKAEMFIKNEHSQVGLSG